jgi:hypothetical protein
MATDELSRLMHEAAPRGGTPVDLHRVHALGRRRRRAARVATGTAALAVVIVLGGVWTLLSPGSDRVPVRATSQDHRSTGVTAYEKKALADVRGSYEVDGTVVLPDVADPQAPSYQPVRQKRIIGTPQALGFHGTVGPMYLPSRRTEEAYQDNAPKGSQVVIDPGPAFLGCVRWPGMTSGCSPSVLVKDLAGHFVFLHGFGSDDFLKPGADMELFTDDDYSDHRWAQSLIGGFHGADTARVLVEMTDGSQAEAQLDVSMSPGNTLFWAKLATPVALVRAYDDHGRLLAEHRLRACTNPVDCEVR